ncbi:sigma-70 family RNA polymerase sigma factor [Pseudonocardia humida]|uniref:Sigma-70 family RNA polymerase sigma factor n=1 Tax=Pseudonocardia humida TaxID=2800819 RepID=A0ABT1AA95_9PSEU|nr:sigma-70 family RNA polymerase sigma factor [Pseudonocardia humida]MCO1659918.1 sigma-70 family RNA polymerase sigma factor [Pseudonocardia humida]
MAVSQRRGPQDGGPVGAPARHQEMISMRLSAVDVVAGSGSSSADPIRSSARSLVAATPSHRRTEWSAATDPLRSEVDEAVADFERVRPRLFGIAYQVLGGAADAEDIVQDVWVRWQGADRAQVRDRVAFLVTVTTRLALNAVTSARARREVSVGGPLPERGSGSVDPALRAVRGEELGLAVQLLCGRLTAVERAVYVLREAFDYPFREIAAAIGTSEVNARQLARRARKHLVERPQGATDPGERDGLLQAFRHAARSGDMGCLIDLLTAAAAGCGASADEHPAGRPT